MDVVIVRRRGPDRERDRRLPFPRVTPRGLIYIPGSSPATSDDLLVQIDRRPEPCA
jgi:hypothetical protein